MLTLEDADRDRCSVRDQYRLRCPHVLASGVLSSPLEIFVLIGLHWDLVPTMFERHRRGRKLEPAHQMAGTYPRAAAMSAAAHRTCGPRAGIEFSIHSSTPALLIAAITAPA